MTSEAPQISHNWQVRVYYEDTDFSGIVYHAAYLKFFERGRTEFLRAQKVSHSELLKIEPPLALAVRKMDIDWRAPARIDDLLDIETTLAELRGARMTLQQTARRDGAALVGAKVEIVCMQIGAGARRFPPELVAAFSAQ